MKNLASITRIGFGFLVGLRAAPFHSGKLERNHRASQKGFSLVEVMVVLGIIVILGSVAASMGTSVGKLGSAGNQVVDLVHQARENSITKNGLTSLILVNSSTRTDWNNRVFILAELTPGATSWTQISKAEMLPSGTIVDDTNPQDATKLTDSFKKTTITNSPSLTYQGVVLNASNCLFQIFLPDGSLMSNGTTTAPTLSLVSGFMNGTSITPIGNQANYFQVTLNSYTGLPKISRP